ncbi:uncharacterized protein BO88DRAFT_461677 [Aspergillus vadensis CBS 113365]|uniref:Protein kinase domain-containing protein n=1 Tax=Aspergillus vadensis (strain CBS 113365 / IMI 142717 / IBT 24658) TaxID=1448311 RepID=A0A319BBN9_ASPVC|nr:hypothetical protein BO88DRAFT_461677 [Aspergillus vadensis CBS 113365]PYH69411.1 hypothetical protein BO88DRAFT_461677 [Aspergillus vadensis CBS 113365]
MLNLNDLGFIRCVKNLETSSVFYVSLQGRLRLMKVYHAIEKEVDPYICESAAYVRLKGRGLCQQGIVPDFYGVIDQIDPRQWQPHLNGFLKDKHRPNAILLEYIPNLKQIGLETYTEDRAAALLSIIQKIHEAGICHCDPYPRNMMVQPETDRVLWIDFDRAQTVSDESITDRHHSWMEDDTLMTAELLDFLAKDRKLGKLDHVWGYYYHYS